MSNYRSDTSAVSCFTKRYKRLNRSLQSWCKTTSSLDSGDSVHAKPFQDETTSTNKQANKPACMKFHQLANKRCRSGSSKSNKKHLLLSTNVHEIHSVPHVVQGGSRYELLCPSYSLQQPTSHGVDKRLIFVFSLLSSTLLMHHEATEITNPLKFGLSAFKAINLKNKRVCCFMWLFFHLSSRF